MDAGWPRHREEPASSLVRAFRSESVYSAACQWQSPYASLHPGLPR